MFGSAASGSPASRIPRSARSAVGPAPWFVPIAATSSPASLRAASVGADPTRHLGLVVEREERDDGQRRDPLTASTATTSSSRSKNASIMKRSTPLPSRTLACAA